MKLKYISNNINSLILINIITQVRYSDNIHFKVLH